MTNQLLPPQMVLNVVQPQTPKPAPQFELYNLDQTKFDAVIGIVRHVLTFAGGLLASKGYTDASEWEIITGGIVMALTMAWSTWQKMHVSGPVVQLGAGDAVPRADRRSTDPQPEPVRAEIPEQPTPRPNRFCPKCEAAQTDDALFCRQCGTKQPEPMVPSTTPPSLPKGNNP